MRRILKIGVPSGFEGLLTWIAQFTVVIVINSMDKTTIAAAAHINAVKIESLSYLPGFAFAMAVATMVGQSLGMKDPQRANRSTYLAYLIGGGMMTLWGVVFILYGQVFANLMLPGQPEIARVTARCLMLAGFVQSGFAAAMVFSGALRGAGDTMAVMILNLASVIFIRLAGVLVVVFVFKLGIVAVWVVLCTELMTRGVFLWLRFASGKWSHVEV
jgi:Na+-driven multidrug efflux pump